MVLHVASPMAATRQEDEVVRPAVDGVVRVLRAARDAGVRRVVYTSSCGAVYYGHPPQPEPFDEASWTDVSSREMSAYVRSKALAERAAWDFVTSEGGDLELATVNPTGIFGPGLDPGHLSSLSLVKRLLDGRPPACPDLWFGVVDVRDVADLHVRAMTDPVAAGERFIASGGPPGVDARHRPGPQGSPRRGRAQGADQTAARLGRPRRRPVRRRGPRPRAPARSAPQRHERQGPSGCWAGRRARGRRR